MAILALALPHIHRLAEVGLAQFGLIHTGLAHTGLTQAELAEVGPSCEPLGPAGWEQPGSAWTSLAFVVAGLLIALDIVIKRRKQAAPSQCPHGRCSADESPSADRGQAASGRCRRGLPPAAPNTSHGSPHSTSPWGMAWVMAVMAVGNGIGSVIQHGPAPRWNPIVHDPPLMGALAVVLAVALADITGRHLRSWWWAAPTALTALLAWLWPPAASASMALVAVPAIALSLWRMRIRPDLRLRIGLAVAILAAGALVGSLSVVGGPWCRPGSAWFDAGWSGHMIWHVLAAASLWIIAPTLQPAPQPTFPPP